MDDAMMNSESQRSVTNSHAVRKGLSFTDQGSTTLNDHQTNTTLTRKAQRTSVVMVDGVLRKFCFRRTYTLRYQLFLSFGTVAIISISIVAITALLTALLSGNTVKNVARSNLENWATTKTVVVSRFITDTVTEKLRNFEALSRIMRITTEERFLGYPDAPGYHQDLLVPFIDMDTNIPKYPLNATQLLPFDWQWESNLNQNNKFQHLQHRTTWYDFKYITTATPDISIQGSCDPTVTDTTSRIYYPNCTDQNNDVSTGGKIAPTTTFASIHKKSSDYSLAVLKPLFEHHGDIKRLGFYFANDGAGAVVRFPPNRPDQQNTYTSIGCDWMNTPHPLDDTRKLGTPEQISRCHERGQHVSPREYNPLERKWCMEQAINPESFQTIGPYLDAHTPGLWLMTFGQAIYDSVTKEFIGCTLADISIERFTEIIGNKKLMANAETSLVRWKTGTVVASDLWDPNMANSPVDVTEIHNDITPEVFNQMKQHFYDNWGPDTPVYQSPTITTDSSFLASHPVPIPPTVYDEDYQPKFFIIISFAKNDVLGEVFNLEEDVDSDINGIMIWTGIFGLVGIICVVLVILLVSVWLTTPMQWMDKVGSEIIHSFGSVNRTPNYEETSWLKFSPTTEITMLVKAFQKMLKKFSGSGTAKLFKHREIEVQNHFDLKAFFEILYSRRQSPEFKHSYGEFLEVEEKHAVRMGGLMPKRKHWGPSFRGTDDISGLSSLQLGIDTVREEKKIWRSQLFWWMFGSIMIPLLVTMMVMSIYVLYSTSTSLPGLIDTVKDTYAQFERDSLPPIARIRAEFATEVITGYLRDLHLYYRVTGWLLFGAISRSDSYSTTVSLAERCKDQPNNNCSYNRTKYHICDCKSNDKFKERCIDYDEDTRKYQHMWIQSSADDAWPNGDRNFTSFPNIATSPNTTTWWEPDNLPGVEKGSSAAGYKTTYDRVRVSSAASMVMIPLLNYDDNSQLEASTGIYHAFEHDGMLIGFNGCSSYDPGAAFFTYTETTTSNTDLCPVGKYGYDARCRPWYVKAKQVAFDALPDGDFLHVTPPFNFTESLISSTATISWMDPLDGTYVGQALIDVDNTRIIERLSPAQTPLLKTGFRTMITTKRDKWGFDTVVGPGLTFGQKFGLNFSAIEDLLLMYDICVQEDSIACRNRLHFLEEILKKKQMGEEDYVSFNRTASDGHQERIHYAFAPVEVPSFRSVNASDTSQGLLSFSSTPYSIGVGITEIGLYESFKSVKNQLYVGMALAISFMTVTIVTVFLCVAFVSSRVTHSIVIPVSQLLSVVEDISRSDVTDDLPEIIGGSREVICVRDTFENLHNVIRYANVAYFNGDLEDAYISFTRSLELFTKLGNFKAIAVANNNLGNMMLTMYRLLKKTGATTVDRMTKTGIVKKGLEFYSSAIDSGEIEIDRINQEEGFSTNYLIFMQQLSNRYFHRAMFLLTTNEDHDDPNDALHRGRTDLLTARDMDREVVDNGDKQGFKGESDVHFDLLISRIKGNLRLLEMGYEDMWHIEDLLDDAQKLLSEALKNPFDALFRGLEPAGQMQRMDGVLMEYYRLSDAKDPVKAAEIAIRMLVEDDYVMGETAALALKILIEYADDVEAEELGGEDPSDLKAALYRLRRHTGESLSVIVHGDHVFSKEMFRQSNVGDLSMEMF